MKLYLDTCSLHRPVDDRNQVRVSLEAEAILAVLALCETGSASLISSDALYLEVSKNRHPQRKAYVIGILAKSASRVIFDDTIEARARELEGNGFKTLDALHLACGRRLFLYLR